MGEIAKPTCAALMCPCGCGKIVRYWHGPRCDPDTCDIEDEAGVEPNE